jgi:hypothetical protein
MLSPARFVKTPSSNMKQVDEIIYDAITADETLMALTGGRVVSTCFEVPPTEDDNTPVPNIIITDDGLTNQPTSKDMEWEAEIDRVQASVDVAAEDPKQVKQLIRMVRKAIANYIKSMDDKGEEIPYLQSLQTTGVEWDWMKPCYHSVMIYQCDVKNNLYDNGND